MFRTARGFLLVAPPAFLAALVAFLVVHPHALESYAVYPVLADVLGPGLTRRPFARFVATSVLFFLIPYLVTGLLLFFADLGLAAAAPLWSGKRRGPARASPPEARVAFFAGTALIAAVGGGLLHRVAHGGELPGRINVAPLLVAMVPFGAMLVGLLVGGLAGLPRLVLERRPGARKARRSGGEASV